MSNDLDVNPEALQRAARHLGTHGGEAPEPGLDSAAAGRASGSADAATAIAAFDRSLTAFVGRLNRALASDRAALEAAAAGYRAADESSIRASRSLIDRIR